MVRLLLLLRLLGGERAERDVGRRLIIELELRRPGGLEVVDDADEDVLRRAIGAVTGLLVAEDDQALASQQPRVVATLPGRLLRVLVRRGVEPVAGRHDAELEARLVLDLDAGGDEDAGVPRGRPPPLADVAAEGVDPVVPRPLIVGRGELLRIDRDEDRLLLGVEDVGSVHEQAPVRRLAGAAVAGVDGDLAASVVEQVVALDAEIEGRVGGQGVRDDGELAHGFSRVGAIKAYRSNGMVGVRVSSRREEL